MDLDHATPIHSSTMPNLPQELVEAVIDSVVLLPKRTGGSWQQTPDHIITLQSCSLVCKNWLPRSRRHLFHTFKIDAYADWRAGADIARKFEPLMETNDHPSCLPPEVTCLVRNLRISALDKLIAALTVNQDFLGCLPFTALTGIEIINEPAIDPEHPVFDGSCIDTRLLLAKNDMLESLRIYYASFSCCRDLMEMVLPLQKNLQFHTLDLEWIHIPDEPDKEDDEEEEDEVKERLRLELLDYLAHRPGVTNQPSCQLRTLKYRIVDVRVLEPLFLHPNSVFDLLTLEQLEFNFDSMNGFNWNPALQLLTRCESLVRLRMDVSCFVWYPSDECKLDPTPFRHLKTLDCLELDNMIDRSMDGCEQEHATVIRAIFTELSNLRCLRLHGSHDYYRIDESELDGSFDSALSTLPTFLREIQVDMNDFDDFLRLFPRACARGFVTGVQCEEHK
ncbi:hypothetical protein D9758_007914 [Tetrapyrgos nigripes]|uniref:Uncharacterized protein n=1 Tax=Tetrapyrgos nigripes TaxID=182062 RepID=A0A8H5FXL2_9AGAR|nr:hypothetical protein D9758_007914 [Tetrapyrgos nigripes]